MEAARKKRMSLEEYIELERHSADKHEYMDGEIFLMSGGSPNHGIIQVNLYASLHGQLRDRSCVVFPSDNRVFIKNEGVYTYPDVSIVCGERKFDEHDNLLNPTSLIEVLSPSTEAYDRGKKFDMYQTLESLKEYGLVAQDERKIYLYTRQEGDVWIRRTAAGEGARIVLEAIGCELNLSDVYWNVTFE